MGVGEWDRRTGMYTPQWPLNVGILVISLMIDGGYQSVVENSRVGCISLLDIGYMHQTIRKRRISMPDTHTFSQWATILGNGEALGKFRV